jgi:predicted 3-demethylubiquinone-9 3-methyltransferase (glyoxalase superfamily)
MESFSIPDVDLEHGRATGREDPNIPEITMKVSAQAITPCLWFQHAGRGGSEILCVGVSEFAPGQREIDYFWSKLSEEGEEGPCGWLKDKYGLSCRWFPPCLRTC